MSERDRFVDCGRQSGAGRNDLYGGRIFDEAGQTLCIGRFRMVLLAVYHACGLYDASNGTRLGLGARLSKCFAAGYDREA